MEEIKEVKTNEEEEKSWIQQELEEKGQNEFEGEKLPALKLEAGKITTFTVDDKQPFQKWIDPNDNTVKKIIPVFKDDDEKFVFWLNIRNPIYRQILEGLKSGKTTFKVLRTGERENTRYTLVEE